LLPYINEGTTVTSQANARATAAGVTLGGRVVLRISPI
jgi:hypothetical protein